MHIPDNYLSPQTCAVMFAAAAPAWVISVRKVKKELPPEKVAMMGVGAAFSFLGMMFNVPLPGGTTGHAVGGTLIALLLGPYASCISVSIALLLQALIFGDGGILSFGANCFNMAFVLPFVGYAIAHAISPNWGKNKKRDLIGAGIGSYIGINAAALCAAIEFGIQTMLFKDASGNALYCPYGLNVSIPAMMAGHLTLFGLAEVVFTVAVLAFVWKAAPDFDNSTVKAKTALPVKILLGVLICAVPVGLLAEGTAWGEWGADEISGTGAGYVPKGIAHGINYPALLPDYSFSGLPDWFGYILSAVVGVALLVIIFRIISYIASKGSRYDRAVA
ncbi:MAG: cobalt transporter CbiM [Lachnospiraceae bacterium]|uniref:Cobalt transporter CbiM n=1 Tax=Candidatus Weimeria bifida TaxID=2599074 RepID=A0A6N7J335_9FIRM|nr:cobalt transporter CbiM [Candidatus Weimeria bifida]RRF96792.1 MAG: cobalt transporter CbiM [Lachnospiraceae bacterium]